MVGRSVRLDRGQGSRPRRASRCWRSPAWSSTTTGGIRAVDGVDLTVRAGEVLGVAGVQGNGQTELIEAIMGLRPALAGTVTLDGQADARLVDQEGAPRRRRLRARGPQRRRPGQGVHRRREPGAGHLRPAAVRQRARRSSRTPSPTSAKERIEQFDIRTSSAERAGGHPLRRQPAEGDRGPGDVPAAEALHRRPADPRRRRRLDRVHPQPDHPRAGRRHRRAGGLQRAGRGDRRWPTGSR